MLKPGCISEGMKYCTNPQCMKRKSLREFARNRKAPDGRCAWCKDCNRAYAQSDKGKTAHRTYLQTDKGKANRAACAAKRARRVKSAGPRLTPTLRRHVLAGCRGLCALCGIRKATHVDHIKPLAKGGTNWWYNLQGLCASCNSLKGATWPMTLSLRERCRRLALEKNGELS